MALEQPPVEVTDISISEDGRTLSESMSVPAPGVYDPSKQLTDQEVIDLKAKLKADSETGYQLTGRMCAHIVVGMLTDGYGEISEEDAEAAAQEGEEIAPLVGEGGEYKDEAEFGRHVGVLSISWALCLQEVIQLPGAEWKDGITPPATFAEALKEIEGLDYLGREVVDG